MQTKHELIPEPIGLDPDALPKPLDFAALYGNTNPVELEIGMGKGTFLTEQAKARPDVNFFGIEWARWFWRYASDRLRRNKCDNARTVRAEASFFLSEVQAHPQYGALRSSPSTQLLSKLVCTSFSVSFDAQASTVFFCSSERRGSPGSSGFERSVPLNTALNCSNPQSQYSFERERSMHDFTNDSR